MLAALQEEESDGDRLLDAARRLAGAFTDLLKAAQPGEAEVRQRRRMWNSHGDWCSWNDIGTKSLEESYAVQIFLIWNYEIWLNTNLLFFLFFFLPDTNDDLFVMNECYEQGNHLMLSLESTELCIISWVISLSHVFQSSFDLQHCEHCIAVNLGMS